jgi:hypothetical protein
MTPPMTPRDGAARTATERLYRGASRAAGMYRREDPSANRERLDSSFESGTSTIRSSICSRSRFFLRSPAHLHTRASHASKRRHLQNDRRSRSRSVAWRQSSSHFPDGAPLQRATASRNDACKPTALGSPLVLPHSVQRRSTPKSSTLFSSGPLAAVHRRFGHGVPAKRPH